MRSRPKRIGVFLLIAGVMCLFIGGSYGSVSLLSGTKHALVDLFNFFGVLFAVLGLVMLVHGAFRGGRGR